MKSILLSCAFLFVMSAAMPAAMSASSTTSSETPKESTEQVKDTVVEPILEAIDFRPWVVTAHYSFFDLVLPSKYGAAIARRTSDTAMWEFEYTKGNFIPFLIDDLGSFSEERLSLIRRHTSQPGHGFQWFYGAFYHRFKLQIGDALLSRLTGGYYPSADVISIAGLGFTLGFGYRWLIKEKFVIGIDALAWSQPLFTTTKETKFLDFVTNQTDREHVDTAVRVMQYFPRFAAAKLSVGYNF